MNAIKNWLLLSLLLLFGATNCISQANGWSLITDEPDMKIYSRLPEDSKFKELKIIADMPATPQEIVDFIGIGEKFPEWIYSCSEAKMINKGELEELYYIRFEMIWPIWDRDIVQHSNTTIDKNTGVVDIKTEAVTGHLPDKEDAVRITKNSIRWKLVPQSNNRTLLYYYAKSDPGGSVPAWLMNMVVSIGPKNTIRNLMKELKTSSGN